MLPDSLTNTVFLSEWLPEVCPAQYQNLEKLFKEHGVDDSINEKKILADTIIDLTIKMKTTNKKVISPFTEDAFSEPVLHQVVLNQIDFALPDFIWEEINEGFEKYWDEEVGLGNYVYFEDACLSIQRHLNCAGIMLPYDKLEIIMEILFDFIAKIPGAFLDESAMVKPKSKQ